MSTFAESRPTFEVPLPDEPLDHWDDLPPRVFGAAGRSLRFTPASSIRLRRPVWHWDTAPAGSAPQDSQGRIPAGSLTIAAGQAGIGKSQWSAWLGARTTRGTLPGCYFGTPKSVVVAASEDSWEMTIGPRWVAAGADLTRVFRVDVTEIGEQHAQLTLPTDTAALGDLIVKHGVALLICDPLLSALSADVNDYRGKEVRAALDPLVAMADRTRCTVIGLAHFNKAAPSGDPLLAIQGAAAFGQLIRAGIGFAREDVQRDGEEPTAADSSPLFVMSTVKNNLGRDNLPSLEYRITPAAVDTHDGTAWVSRFEFTGEEAGRSVKEIMRATADGRHAEMSHGQRSIDDWLLALLGEKDYRATEVYQAADAVGYSKDQAKRAKARLGIEAFKPKFDGPWHWRLRTTTPTPREHEAREASTHTDTARFAPLPAPFAVDVSPTEANNVCMLHDVELTSAGKCGQCSANTARGGDAA